MCYAREREKCFYLTTHSTHFIYGYMASDIWLRTILIVRKETRCRHIGYSYRLTARVLLYAPSHRQDNTYHGLCYTSRGALAGTRNSSVSRNFFLSLYECIIMSFLFPLCRPLREGGDVRERDARGQAQDEGAPEHPGPGVAPPVRVRHQPRKPQTARPRVRVPHAAQGHDDRRAQDRTGES